MRLKLRNIQPRTYRKSEVRSARGHRLSASPFFSANLPLVKKYGIPLLPSLTFIFPVYPAGQFSIIASHGENLPNKDTPSIDKTSDVFLKITAYDRQGKSRSLRTEVIRDNLNPIWNETIIDFGRRAWSWFKVEVGMTIQIYQDQIYNRLSAACKYNLTSFTPMMEERVNCYRGYVAFILAISEKNCSPLYY